MPAWQRTYVAACAGVIAFALAYIGVDYAKLPRAVYDPLSGRWTMGRPQGLAMGYVGQWGWALLAFGVAAGLVAVLLRARKRPIGERGLGLGLAWTVTAMVLAVGFTTWNNWP